MNKRIFSAGILAAVIFASCGAPKEKDAATEATIEVNEADAHESSDFNYTADQFADLKLIRYQVPGFEELSAQEKELLYYLYEAALCGRDMMYDQNFRHNLRIRKTLEAIVAQEDSYSNDKEYPALLVYTKRVWFSNGIHHHYSNKKFEPEFSKEYFAKTVQSLKTEDLPLKKGESKDELIAELTEVIFNPALAPKKVSLDPETDMVANSAVNFYSDDMTQKDVEEYYASLDKVEKNQPEYGLNTRLVKENGKVVAQTYKIGGLYSEAIEKIVYWIEKAAKVAENDQQKLTLDNLVKYYKSGDVLDWDSYNIAWVNDTNSRTDVVNGFIEVYNDPLGYKGTFESVVSFKDMEATKRIETVSKEAQWFEDNSPIQDLSLIHISEPTRPY